MPLSRPSVRPDSRSNSAASAETVAPDACTFLQDGFPGLKALALDCISLASYGRIDPEGIVAHQILCGVGRGDRYVLIIEDLDLSVYPPGPPPARLYAIPLFPEGTDSSPCTVFAELHP